MTVIKINAITVPEDAGDELARRFAARAGAVDNQEGFEGFELLRPTDDRRQWLVVTRWRDEAAFEAWRTSPAFGHGHGSAAGGDEYENTMDTLDVNGAKVGSFSTAIDCAPYAKYSPDGNPGIFTGNTTGNPRNWCPGAPVH